MNKTSKKLPEGSKIFCPKCEAKLDLSGHEIASKISCPSCEELMDVPACLKPVVEQEFTVSKNSLDPQMDLLLDEPNKTVGKTARKTEVRKAAKLRNGTNPRAKKRRRQAQGSSMLVPFLVLIFIGLGGFVVVKKLDNQRFANPGTGENELSSQRAQSTDKNSVLKGSKNGLTTEGDFDRSKLKLSVEDYFAFINLDYTGLELAKKACADNQWQNAAQCLLDYYRKRFPVPRGRLVDEDRKNADLALKHYFKGNKSNPHIFRGKEIDWFSKAVHEQQTIHENEWLFQFHRLTWWPALGKAFHATGDERYLNEWETELISYIDKVFPLTKKSPWFVRRGMECENRNRCLMQVLPFMIHSPKFDSETLLSVLYMLHHQTEQIRKVYAKKGNHLLADLDGVLATATQFPEFKKSDEWLDEVLNKYPGLMFSEILADGMNKELIFSYHTMYIGLFTKFYKKLEGLGLEDRLPDEFHQRLEKMHEIFAYQAYPDMTYCQFGDAWKKDPGALTWMFKKHHQRNYPNNEFYSFLASSGERGSKPQVSSRAYPESGFYFLRSDWSDQAIFMPVKANKTKGEWHNHIDNGTFGLYAYGRNFMNDSGSYLYASDDPEQQRWREWFKSTKVHQTLTLNEQNINLESECLYWSDESKLTALVFENNSYENLRHRRTILFVDKQYFIIHDQAIGDAEGEVKIHFQLVPSEIVFNASEGLVSTQFKSGPNLVVHSRALQGKTQLEKEDGWISYEQKIKQERPAWCLKQDKKAEQDLGFLTVLEPLREGEKSRGVNVSVLPFEGGIKYLIESSKGKREVSLKYGVNN